jgi:hypothetical protein
MSNNDKVEQKPPKRRNKKCTHRDCTRYRYA